MLDILSVGRVGFGDPAERRKSFRAAGHKGDRLPPWLGQGVFQAYVEKRVSKTLVPNINC